MRVVVAMSGGVDSSVAAALMHEAGHEVVGLTMKLRDAAPSEPTGGTCCTLDDARDAARVCAALGVPHYVVDYREAFRRDVIEPFARSYLDGRTPNPCVLCNDHLKFDALLARCDALGAERLVTGHYARVEVGSDGRYTLRRGVDAGKDQSYFLFGMDQRALAMTRFPLGGLDKPAVRDHARRLGLPVAEKADSEDICFVPDGDYARVVLSIVGPDAAPGPGEIVDERGRPVGVHGGVHRFTIGQRKGLGVAGAERLYVLAIDGPSRTITVGPADRLPVPGLVAARCRWIAGGAPPAPCRVSAQIRYRHPGAPARLEADAGSAVVTFEVPQPAVAPGQAVVFYDADRVLGGGWIDRPRRAGSGEEAMNGG